MSFPRDIRHKEDWIVLCLLNLVRANAHYCLLLSLPNEECEARRVVLLTNKDKRTDARTFK